MSESSTVYVFSSTARSEQHGSQWVLSGAERATQQPLRLVLVTDDARVLPATVAELEVRRETGTAAGAGIQQWRLAWSGGVWELAVRSVHVQRGADAQLHAAMPGVAPSRRGRIGWALLLNLARVPGMMRVLQAWRGAN